MSARPIGGPFGLDGPATARDDALRTDVRSVLGFSMLAWGSGQ
jgi:hypothetical protein